MEYRTNNFPSRTFRRFRVPSRPLQVVTTSLSFSSNFGHYGPTANLKVRIKALFSLSEAKAKEDSSSMRSIAIGAESRRKLLCIIVASKKIPFPTRVIFMQISFLVFSFAPFFFLLVVIQYANGTSIRINISCKARVSQENPP